MSSSRSTGANQRAPAPPVSDRIKNGQHYKFSEMQPIDENEISVLSQSPEYGDDSENLKLFPKRHPEWLISSNRTTPNPYQSPSSSLSRSPRNLPMSMNGDNKPLLINNANISSTSGRNGAALNKISNTNHSRSTSDRTRNGRGSEINMDGNGTRGSSNLRNSQRHRTRVGIRTESFQVGVH